MPSPEEVAASCDVTFAMLADPESAVRMFSFDYFCCCYHFLLTDNTRYGYLFLL